MNVGDMKYTFVDNAGVEHTAEIPATVLRVGRREGLSNKESIQRYLFEQGYDVDKPVESTSESAGNTAKKRTRKPNERKRELISLLEKALQEEYENVEVVNPERMVRLTSNGTTYEFTLVQKRK